MSRRILYSFRRCPYAIRARWAILKANINVTIREVSLKNKPIELIKVSPKSTVPVLITEEGEVIDESIDIIIWSLKKAGKLSEFLPTSLKERDKIYLLLKQNDDVFKYHLDRFKYSARYEPSNKIIHKKEAVNILSEWNEKISENKEKGSNGWLFSRNESIADWSIWPFVRQFIITDPSIFNTGDDFKYLREWLNYYLNDPLIEKLMYRMKPWDKNEKPIIYGMNMSKVI
tara:strand:+ start:67252 stop:67941 length:690 start_codon:yes stop_codon:yes gene_type:complete